ncbi:cobyric acid synthase [Desertivirga brevis]|uniref:cobyric acid synthase n=1 Tax=Desertivirga brevis TaxID=2810310 RepID=UPI001A957CAC|nr:cobyric acid synthase [Pedobacter sp. SYSU D00873]
MEKKVVLKPIMFVGTSSDVGKSVITAGFCRIFKQDGFSPAPFKAQNMSLNSFATPEGFEIGRAQAVQAEAAGIPCHTDMNPVLLKPTSDSSSQVVLQGKPVGNMSARDYFKAEGREKLFQEVCVSFNRLASKYSPIVLEGAGSISELNLKHRDITNLRMAREANAATFLVTDIERGGVFASLYGTMALLEPEERALIKGIIINKFRGDSSLFDEGRAMIEKLCGVPVVGVLPYFKDIVIEEEDSVSLKQKLNMASADKVNVAIILLNRLSNFTDFSRLENDPRVRVYYTKEPEEIAKADIVILPGSKNTIEDTIAIKNNGVAQAVTLAFKNGKTVVGICGGYQMLGELIDDPYQVESSIGSTSGLGILPVKTILREEKITKQSSFRFRNLDTECLGYEIHMGETSAEIESPVNFYRDGRHDGYFLNERCWGTYMHGILDNGDIINHLLKPYTNLENIIDYKEFKDQQYNRLADLIRQHVDLDYIYQTMES